MLFVVALGAFLAAYNNVLNIGPTGRPWYVPLNLSVGAALVVLARSQTYSWESLGFSRQGVAPGLRWGGAITAVVAVGLLVALVVPALEPLLHDRRVAGLGASALAYTVLVRIPLGTALVEEVAFRGVFYGVLAERTSIVAAVAWSSVVFGIWHVMPAMEMFRINRPDIPAGLLALGVLGAVVGTAAGGVVLCWFRIRTGGIVAPALVHASANSLATLAAYTAQR